MRSDHRTDPESGILAGCWPGLNNTRTAEDEPPIYVCSRARA